MIISLLAFIEPLIGPMSLVSNFGMGMGLILGIDNEIP
jgi:hypothetical protein